MGRKPNQAIRHFFDRGPKLNDNSNRYQQTCKRCGEKFEKGRQEALIAHIAKTCQGVAIQERERFLAEVQHGKTTAKAKKASDAPTEASPALPELSGLEALAEVSRHHGQQSIQNDIGPQVADFLAHPATTSLTSLPTHYTTSPAFMGRGTLRQLSLQNESLRSAAAQALVPPQASMYQHSLDAADALVDYTHGEAPTLSMNYSRHADDAIVDEQQSSPEAADDLVDYSHGQAPILEQDYTRDQHILPVRDMRQLPIEHSSSPNLDRSLANHDQDLSNFVPSFNIGQTTETMDVSPDAITSAPMTSTIEASTFAFTSGLERSDTQFQMWNPDGSSVSQPKKVRGAFAPDRRTAVKEVRKKGACLRCRMLKKSCDSEDPCKECAKLENARMWKGQCVRTRLSQIFNVFSSTLFMSIAHRTIEEVRNTSSLQSLPGRLEVSYFSSAGLSVTFPCLQITGSENSRAQIIINTENEGVGVGSTFDSKISQYGSRLLALHLGDATTQVMFGFVSRWMYQTLRVALTMADCILVARAVDLFICVTLLTKGYNELLAIHEPRLPPTNVPVDFGHGALQRGEGVHYIYIQLRRKLERTCDMHFKAIMTELEKSLIQRKQADNFETFIGTIILLRCVEMVGYMYKGFDHLVDPTNNARKDVLYGADSWPLDNPPSYYWQQGERFSDLLVSMLRLRKVLPVMKIRDGFVATDSSDKNVKEWFDAMQLRADVLKFARDKPYDSIDGNTWELRWMGKLFDM